MNFAIETGSAIGPCIESPRTKSQDYPQIWFRDRMVPETRFVWQWLHGEPVPEGMFVCHRCDNKRCINGNHLFLGTPKENTQDMLSKGRGGYQKRTHCPRGHPYDEVNTYWTLKGHRGCRECHRIVKRVDYLRRRA